VVICDAITYVVKVLLEIIASVHHLYEAVGFCETFITITRLNYIINPKITI